jgi:ABC-type branched-subunit amino acid transport system substrate-binding protein
LVPGNVRSQSDKIKIASHALTGFGALGEYAAPGVKMAEEESIRAGGVMGRQPDVMSEDRSTATAATKAQRMFARRRDGADGEINPASALPSPRWRRATNVCS